MKMVLCERIKPSPMLMFSISYTIFFSAILNDKLDKIICKGTRIRDLSRRFP